MKYYEDLRQTYQSPKNIELSYRKKFIEKWKEKISDAYLTDQDSILGTYKQVNSKCNDEHLVNYKTMFELERITLTRYRVGAHNLEIVKGRYSAVKVNREERLCACLESIQTLRHFLLECPILENLRTGMNYNTVEDFITSNEAPSYIFQAAKILKIEI